MGTLRTTAFEALTTDLARSVAGAGKVQRNRTFLRGQRPAFENQFSHHRLLLESDPKQVAAWLEYHQTRQPAQTTHSGAYGTEWDGERPGLTDVAGLLHRSQQAISETLRHMRQRLPFS